MGLCSLLCACSSTPAVVPARNLERPGDMGFVCLAIDADGTLSGRPMCACHPPGAKDPPIEPTGTSSRQLGTFALVTNTARGEMAAVDIDNGRLIDLDPGVFGFNMLPVGEMPESLAASPDGCWVATANRNSCDIGLVDPSQLLAPQFGTANSPVKSATDTGSPVKRVVPSTPSGPLNAAPKEIAFLPASPPLCPADPTSWPASCQSEQAGLLVVTFPSCDLVALVDAQTGVIQDSVYISQAGVVAAGRAPTCPVDCAPSSDAGVAADDGGPSATSADGGVSPSGTDAQAKSPLGVGPLALFSDKSRVYVGARTADNFLTALDIVDGTFVIPAGGGRIALEVGAIGIEHLKLGVDPFIPNAPPITLPDGTPVSRGRFLYAFARDGSVRVVNIDVQPEQECDVNVQPDPAGPPANTGCFPVNSKARRPLAQGPGIRIPTPPIRTGSPPIARDIAVVNLPVSSADPITKNPPSLAGQFAFLLASNDYVYILNLAPLTLSGGQVVPENNTLTHSFREMRSTGQLVADTLALSSTPPLRTSVASDLLFPTTPIQSSTSGPRLEEVVDDPVSPVAGNSINATTNYWANFPYQGTYVSRQFTIAWEDVLPETTRSSGVLQAPGTAGAGAAGALVDVGADFCAKGVLAGDLVVLPGCMADTDCTPQETFSCHQPIGGATGLCLPKGAAQTDQCVRLMSSRRRYEIVKANSTELTLGLHLDEVPKTVLNRATLSKARDDAECQPSGHPGFQWQQVWPNEDFKRCVKACGTSLKLGAPVSDGDKDCRPGFVCATLDGSLGPQSAAGPGNYCVEAPPLDLACWPQPTNRYHVNVGNSFLVSGSGLADLKTTKEINGQCQLDANRDPALADRIPMSTPVCATIDGTVPIANATDYSTSKVNTEVALFGQATPPSPGPTDSQWLLTPNAPFSPVSPPGPNPCLFQDFNYDDFVAGASPSTGAGDAGAGTGASDKPIKAIFQNPQMRIVFTNLDQYGGDSLTTRMNLIGGFVPATVTIPPPDVALSQPIRIYTGPNQTPDSPLLTDSTSTISYPYVYVLDQGRTALTPNSRGQILRINGREGDSAIATFNPTASGTTPFQIQ